MKIPEVPPNERDRQHALEEYSILDTLPEQEYEEITLLAAQICRTPISLITLVDTKRQWFKSHRGLSVTETPRDYAFCAHAINNPSDLFLVPDSRKDSRFFDNPLVTGDPHVIFYAGVPLVTSDGFPLGTICVIDHQPREMAPDQKKALQALSNQVVKLLELRKKNRLLSETQKEIVHRNEELKKFAFVVSHDIKSPLNNIISLTDYLKSNYASGFDAEGLEMIDYLGISAGQLKNLVDGILSYYASDKYLQDGKKTVVFFHLVREVVEMLDPAKKHTIRYPRTEDEVTISEAALRQILLNLISNGIKYNRSEQVEIDISLSHHHNDESFEFMVKDNGIGISEEERTKIFEPFTTLGVTDRFKNMGTGIGLSTVKRLVEKMGGTIRVVSGSGTGSEFIVTITQ
jgi:signal transduction histidine kinase